MAKAIFIILLALLGLPIVLANFFADWQFIDYRLQNARTVISCFIVAWLIASFAATKLNNKGAVLSIFVVLTGLAASAGYVLIQPPLDGHGPPKDVATIGYLDNGQKIVVRKMFNPKHNRWERDTVTVQDKWVFRRIIK